jgi:hypothetical protein
MEGYVIVFRKIILKEKEEEVISHVVVVGVLSVTGIFLLQNVVNFFPQF